MSKRIAGVTAAAKALMMAYPWPGSVRELTNIIEHMMILSPGPLFDVADLPEEIRGVPDSSRPPAAGLKPEIQAVRDQVEKNQIGEALEKNNWNVTRTARALGISRATLQNKMKKYGLRRSRST